MSKRITIKKTKGKVKFFQRYAAQDHFNARERGKDKHTKHKDSQVDSTNNNLVMRALRHK